jgi:hypothetical protein
LKSTPSILITTWEDGLHIVTGNAVRRELQGQCVRSPVSDGHGGVFAVVGGHSLCLRSADGAWRTIAKSESPLGCCLAVAGSVFVGTDRADILRLGPSNALERLPGFDVVEGREKWYAGTAIIDGKVMGPPLGIRSMTATCDAAVLLANVHVGGITHSADAGLTWRPTIDIECDVHQVAAHPTRPNLVIAAAAVGLCISRDGGASWAIEARGLHAPHCSAVTFGRNSIYVSASVDPFSAKGAVYRRSIDGDGLLEPLGGGMPRWTNGKVDTDCMAARGSMIAMIDGSGGLYVSDDDGASWSLQCEGIDGPSGLYIC